MKTIEDLEARLVDTAQSKKDWILAAEIMAEAEESESWRDSGLTSYSKWVESLASKYGISTSWLWRAGKAGEHLPEIWPFHSDEPAESLGEIISQIGFNVAPSAIATLAMLAKKKVSDEFIRSVEKQYFSGSLGVTDLIKLTKQVEVAKQRRIDPEIYSALFRMDLGEIFLGKGDQRSVGQKLTVISEVDKAVGLDLLLVVADGVSEPTIIGVRVGLDTRDLPRYVDGVVYVLADSVVEYVSAEGAGIVKVDAITAQYEYVKKHKQIDVIKAKKSSLVESILNHLLCGTAVVVGNESSS